MERLRRLVCQAPLDAGADDRCQYLLERLENPEDDSALLVLRNLAPEGEFAASVVRPAPVASPPGARASLCGLSLEAG